MRSRSVLASVPFVVAFGCARAQIPLPPDLSIETPGSSVPAEDAAFSGAWGNGASSGNIPTALIVEQIAADGTAEAIYARGAAEHPKVGAGWRRMQGRIKDHCLTLPLPDPMSSAGYRIQYRVIAPGRLEGDATNREGWRMHAFLQRIPGPSEAIVATAALAVQPLWRDIRIPEQSKIGTAAGQAIELQATLYRTRLPGRQPLVILNHGSTGGDDRQIPRTLRFEGEARFFLARGYNVVVPMRKGRGQSGGPFLEPSDHSIPSAVQVASAVEDLNTVVDAMRAEAWVDSARIIVAGQSRGGFLSVIYAARFPGKVAGVINFSGGWWSEFWSGSAFNSAELATAGRTDRVPELWLYAGNDSFYTLAYTRKNFDAFRANGGIGSFVAFDSIHGVPRTMIGNGHALFEHVRTWGPEVAAYLNRVDGG
jgi:dienelactone hydrolase